MYAKFPKHITHDQAMQAMQQALSLTNSVFSDNITWVRLEQDRAHRIIFRIRAIDCHGPGGILSIYPLMTRRAPEFYREQKRDRFIGGAACWHAHGVLFDALLKIVPDVIIESRRNKITKSGGNWQDFDAGSMLAPVFQSERCYCKEKGIRYTAAPGFTYKKVDKNFTESEVYIVDQARLTGDCLFVQMRGLSACEGCTFLNTPECGGVATRQRIKDGQYPASGIGVKQMR